jgi:hypothetical protein
MYTLVTQTKDKSTQNSSSYYHYYYSGKRSNFENEKEHFNKLILNAPNLVFS